MPRYFSNYDDWKLSTPEDDMDEFDEFEEERDPDAERQQAEDDRMDREQDR